MAERRLAPGGRVVGLAVIAAAAIAAVSLPPSGGPTPPPEPGPAADWGWSDIEPSPFDAAAFRESQALCRRLADREPPAADRPDARTAESLRGCNSEALYYGIGMSRDPVRARLCAFTEERGDQPIEPFSGRAMLMVIYANGVGARRDLDIAIHLACGLEGAAAESHGRAMHLARLKARGWARDDFHYCDDITSGLAGAYCAGHEATIAGLRRDAGLDRLIAGRSPGEREAFAVLRRALETYAEAHGVGELDHSGSARIALELAARERLRDELAELLRRLAGGRGPAGSRARFEAADAALDAAYRERLRGPFEEHAAAVSADGIGKAQRAWLRYRDAFLAFAAMRFPRASRDGVAGWLTERRTRLLRGEE